MKELKHGLIHVGQQCKVTGKGTEDSNYTVFVVSDKGQIIRSFDKVTVAIDFADLYDRGW